MTSITGQLADFCAGLRTRALPAPVLAHTAAVVLDWLGAALAGASSESGTLTRQLEPLFGGPREASLVGCAQQASLCLAALHNGTSSAVHELDDGHRDAAIHPGVVVLPAALAVAEATRCGARELLGGIVAGYEVMARVGWMLGPSHYHQWHTTSTAGCFGAAAAAGFLWGLDAARLGAALGLADAQAGGVWEGISREAVMVKHFHGGRAAVAGLLAASLARIGYPGAAYVLEGERGLVAAASQSTATDLQTVMASLGTECMVQRNFFKRYPCGLGNFHGLDAVASLAHRYHLAAAEVAAVTVRLTSMSAWMVGNPAPTSIFEAKFSLPFAIATLLTAGRLGVAEYADRWLHDPRIRSLMGRVQLVADETLAADTALVAIHTHGGQRLEGAGTWRTLTLAEVEHKFQDVVGGLLGAGRAARLADLVDDLPRALHRPFFRSAREHICASTRVREHHDEACVPRRPRWQCEEAPRRCRVLSTTVGGMCPDRRLAHRGL